MRRLRRVLLLLFGGTLLGAAPSVRAGLYFSGEEIAPLPSQWRGFLLDQRQLRNLLLPASPLRQRYQKAADALEKAAQSRKLTADESADLGACTSASASSAVPSRPSAPLSARTHATFTLPPTSAPPGSCSASRPVRKPVCAKRCGWRRETAPGGGVSSQAGAAAPRQDRGAQDLDDLFGVRFINDKGVYEPGKLGALQRKKLPAEAAALAQQLALWLPADGRLLWLLAELASAHGDVRTAAAILDGCVTEFGLRAPELHRHRRLMRAAAARLAKAGPTSRQDHKDHAGLLKTRSSRPLVDRRAVATLPPVKPDGLNVLPWFVVTQTGVDRRFRPSFPKYLRDLDGKRVTLTGFMQPLGSNQEMNTFLLIEYPVGCWYCETPELVATVLVELPPGKSHTFTRDPVTVTGQLKLNATEPEDFLYAIRAAAVK